jgi:ribosomal protein S18 acetylase RimI-like enzyme
MKSSLIVYPFLTIAIRSLVQHALADMHADGIERTHIVVLASNPKGMAFWEALGWKRRDGLVLMSYFDEDLETAPE